MQLQKKYNFGKPFFYKNAFFTFGDIWERDHGPRHPPAHPRGRVRASRAGSACKALSRCLQGRSECLQKRLKHGSEYITTYYKVVKSCRKARKKGIFTPSFSQNPVYTICTKIQKTTYLSHFLDFGISQTPLKHPQNSAPTIRKIYV